MQVSPSTVAKIRDALLQAGDHAWQPLSLEPFSTGAANDEVNEALQQMLSPGSFRVRGEGRGECMMPGRQFLGPCHEREVRAPERRCAEACACVP